MEMMRLTNGSVTTMNMDVFSIEHSWIRIRLPSLLYVFFMIPIISFYSVFVHIS